MIYLLIIIGIAMTMLGIRQKYLYSKNIKYDSAKMEVQDNGIRHKRKVAGNYAWDYYIPEISYKYEVDGVIYFGDVVSDDPMMTEFLDEQEVKMCMDNLLKKGLVYFDADNPERSVLILGLSKKRKSHITVLMFVGVLLFTIGIYAAIAGL